MKRILLICLSVCLLGLPAQVQAAWRFSPKQITAAVRRVTTGKKVEPVRPAQPAHPAPRTAQPKARPVRLGKPDFKTAQSHLGTLDARVERSIQDAQQAYNEARHPLLRGPIDRGELYGPGPFEAEYLYPEKLYLQHPQLGAELTEAYFVAKSNRLFTKHLKDMQAYFWPAFEKAKPRFIKEAEALEQPTSLLKWTAQQIPATTKELFIGEIHGHPEIPQFVDDLLQLLHKQNPERKIMLFTEFLWDREGKEVPWSEKVIHTVSAHHRVGLWETAELLDIPLIGLETDKWPYDYDFVRTDPHFEIPILAGATPEGIRIRNDHWHKILQEYRQKNPDALFVVYTGAAHSLYNYPFSLAKRFPKETTLMLDLTMKEIRHGGGVVTSLTDHLEKLDPTTTFPQPVLKWSSPDLIELSGFDIRIKLPVGKRPF